MDHGGFRRDFRISGLDDLAVYSLVVQVPETWQVLAQVEQLLPGGPAVVVAVDPDLLVERSVRFTGRIVDAFGAGVPTAQFSMVGEGSDGVVLIPRDSEGHFETETFPPGEDSIRVMSRDHAPFLSPARHAAAGAVVDFGDLVLDAGGAIEVSFQRVAGASAGVPQMLVRGGGSFVEFSERDGLAVSGPCEPGDHEIEIFGGGDSNVAQGLHPVEVRAGEVTYVELTLERGYARPLRIEHGSSSAIPGGLQLEVFDSSGGRVHFGRLDWRPTAKTFERELRLAPGEYRFVGTTDAGARAEVRATLGPEQEGQALEFEIEAP